MSIFTDDDLKRLKAYIHKGYINEVTFEDVETILARLEAAENVIAHSHGLASTWCCDRAKKLDEAWREAAGK